mmetsp:Transcript_27499/g.51540  ORF Transcript_27499/g.51540 Transcript_27499/m.51540 type:complete len:109 (-) Transcript_27499:800-1126(-)
MDILSHDAGFTLHPIALQWYACPNHFACGTRQVKRALVKKHILHMAAAYRVREQRSQAQHVVVAEGRLDHGIAKPEHYLPSQRPPCPNCVESSVQSSLTALKNLISYI